MPGLTPISDYSRGTLIDLLHRLQQTATPEDLLYREVELDEVWRLIDGDCMAAAPRPEADEAAESLAVLRAGIHEVHDLVADGLDGHAAARRLSETILALGDSLEQPSLARGASHD